MVRLDGDDAVETECFRFNSFGRIKPMRLPYWAIGITANCIAPGVIATGRIMATVIPGSIQSNRDRAELVALRRLGTVEDCAKVVEFLATDLSDYVTGAVIPIDGGLVRG